MDTKIEAIKATIRADFFPPCRLNHVLKIYLSPELECFLEISFSR